MNSLEGLSNRLMQTCRFMIYEDLGQGLVEVLVTRCCEDADEILQGVLDRSWEVFL